MVVKVYCAGPMSGIPRTNIPAFDAAAQDLRDRGIEVVSPAELDDPEIRAAALASPDGTPVGPWEEFLARDLQIVCEPGIDAVVVLPGWENSKGARFETDVARRLGKPILRYPDLEPVEPPGDEAPRHVREGLERLFNRESPGEVRVTDPKTGGEKGRKPERYDLIPWRAFDEVTRVYHHGSNKYSDWNWSRGFDWSLSIGACFRHMAAFASGEDTDPESGLAHPAHAVFHMLALLTFMSTHPEGDDRWTPTNP